MENQQMESDTETRRTLRVSRGCEGHSLRKKVLEFVIL